MRFLIMFRIYYEKPFSETFQIYRDSIREKDEKRRAAGEFRAFA